MHPELKSIAHESGLSELDFALFAKAHVAALLFTEIAHRLAEIARASRYSQVSLRATIGREQPKRRRLRTR